MVLGLPAPAIYRLRSAAAAKSSRGQPSPPLPAMVALRELCVSRTMGRNSFFQGCREAALAAMKELAAEGVDRVSVSGRLDVTVTFGLLLRETVGDLLSSLSFLSFSLLRLLCLLPLLPLLRLRYLLPLLPFLFFPPSAPSAPSPPFPFLSSVCAICSLSLPAVLVLA